MFADWNLRRYDPFYRGPYQTDISITSLLPVAAVLFIACLFYLRRRGRSAGYLFCFGVFSVYLWYLASYTVFPFPLHYAPRGLQHAGLHLVPALIEGDDPSFRIQSEQVWGNFLTGVPFGFGLPFLVASKRPAWRRMICVGLAFAVVPEAIQLLQNVLFVDFVYRSVDVDDVWLCFAGTLVGYGVFRAAAFAYRRIGWARGARLPVWDHIHAVLMAGGPETAIFRKEEEG